MGRSQDAKARYRAGIDAMSWTCQPALDESPARLWGLRALIGLASRNHRRVEFQHTRPQALQFIPRVCDGCFDPVSYTHLTLPTTPYV